MKVHLILLGCLLASVGCSAGSHQSNEQQSETNNMEPNTGKDFTDSDACTVLLRDLKVPIESELGKALVAERFSRDNESGDCFIETQEEQVMFNVKKKRFRIVRGIEPKTGAPHVIWGEFIVSEAGELRARFP
jgi:hypothetical protein